MAPGGAAWPGSSTSRWKFAAGVGRPAGGRGELTGTKCALVTSVDTQHPNLAPRGGPAAPAWRAGPTPRVVKRLATLCGFVTVVWAAAAGVFHVAPSGSDAADGSVDHPFASLTRARDACRGLPAGAAKDIVVHGGKYFNVCLWLGPEDSNLTIEAAPGEKPLLYGGQRLSGWTQVAANLYAAPLPAFPAAVAQSPVNNLPGGWQVRMLLVDGVMAPRARYPASGKLTCLNSFPVRWLSSALGWERPPTTAELTQLVYQPGDLGAWLSLTNAEVMIDHSWSESCVGVATNDTSTHTLVLSPAPEFPPGAFRVNTYTVWNLQQGLTGPGQWYQDRAANRIVYWPLPGQDPATMEVIVPTTTRIVVILGSSTAAVTNLTLRGLGFGVTTVPLLAGGSEEGRYDGALTLQGTVKCRLQGLSIGPVAGHAISLRGASNAGDWIQDCELSHCGAGGLYANGSQNTIISNNYVHDFGLLYPGGIGIEAGSVASLTSHNTVRGGGYTGIIARGQDGVVESNLVFSCMQALNDGGGIYLSLCSNLVVRGNLVRDMTGPVGINHHGIYLDEGAHDSLVTGNVVQGVPWPMMNHMATNNAVVNNVFLVAGDLRLSFFNSTNYTFSKNIVLAAGGVSLDNPGAVGSWSTDLFFSQSGKTNGIPAAAAQGDPGLSDPAGTNFSFTVVSPATGLGILPLEVRGVGYQVPPPIRFRFLTP